MLSSVLLKVLLDFLNFCVFSLQSSSFLFVGILLFARTTMGSAIVYSRGIRKFFHDFDTLLKDVRWMSCSRWTLLYFESSFTISMQLLEYATRIGRSRWTPLYFNSSFVILVQLLEDAWEMACSRWTNTVNEKGVMLQKFYEGSEPAGGADNSARGGDGNLHLIPKFFKKFYEGSAGGANNSEISKGGVGSFPSRRPSPTPANQKGIARP